ncbi:MAG: transcription antitermination factor NusB [Actinomycetes bacterium]|nr:MAG: transcription antitermination factor NusB [Actinomycetota bacterium]
MGARSKARKRALDVLFEADQRGVNVASVLEERLKDPGRETPLPEYAQQILRGVIEQWVDVNARIADAAQEWTLDRMPAVDRAVLRIGAWEIVHNPDVAPAVAIDEAVELATSLSTDESPKFVNGVLGRVAREAGATE